MLADKIGKLRKLRKISQEKMAEMFSVSRQAVQKWENGTSVPDLDNLVRIAEYFDVSLDYLINGKDYQNTEEMVLTRKIEPSYSTMHTWENCSAQLMVEYDQCCDEGKDMKPLKGLFAEVDRLPEGREKKEISDVLFQMVMKAPMREGYSYREPSDYTGIRHLCTQNPEAGAAADGGTSEGNVISDDVLYSKIKGAWYGRVCGCLLGKPIEGFMSDEIRRLLEGTGNWPMKTYIYQKAITEDVRKQFDFNVYDRCYADTLTCAPADDDTNYVVLASELVERYGRNFTSRNVAELWLETQPKSAYCTAERVAFRNFVNGYLPPESAIYKNPYREWIGAQIRGDYFGYINPGKPQEAAEMAYRDAVISHVKNGIYGEMFVAAMLAWAAVCQDMEEVIRVGLNEIPVTSRLYESIIQVITWKQEGKTYDEVIGEIFQIYDEKNVHHWDHTISNAMIVAAALLYGDGDFARSICYAVQIGFDTDCNGATVGSIVGMMKGYDQIPEEWVKPLRDELDTDIFRVGKVRLEDMVERTIKHIRLDNK